MNGWTYSGFETYFSFALSFSHTLLGLVRLLFLVFFDFTLDSAKELKNRLTSMSKEMRKNALGVTAKDRTLPSGKGDDDNDGNEGEDGGGSSKVEKMAKARKFGGLLNKKKSQVAGSAVGGYFLLNDKYLETIEAKAVSST